MILIPKRRGKRRMLHNSICRSNKFNTLPSDQARLLYCLMITDADDYGHLEAEPAQVKINLVPGLDWDLAGVRQAIYALAQVDLIRLYLVNDLLYAEIVLNNEHQSFGRAKEAQYPEPVGFIKREQLTAVLTALDRSSMSLSLAELSGAKLSVAEQSGSTVAAALLSQSPRGELAKQVPVRKRQLADTRIHPFERSPFFDFPTFRAALPDWDDAKVQRYYDAACAHSNNGGKKIDWIKAVKNWDRRDSTPKPGHPGKYQERKDNVIT
jgi:hypothetical protein